MTVVNRGIATCGFLLLASVGSPLSAQTAAIIATVTDSTSAAPLSGATVEIAAAGNVIQTSITTRRGGAELTDLAAGVYTLSISRIGYRPVRVEGIRLAEGDVREIAIRLVASALSLDPIVVTASRSAETVFDAPRSVSVVERKDIEARPVLSVIDRIASLPGVETISGGIVQRRYTVRGQNFGTASQLRTIADGRYTVLPNIDYNLPYALSFTDEDIERIELLRGPAAALYGPNTNRGVLQIVTRSPFDSEGTAVSLTGGERSLFQGTFRHAAVVSDKVAFKISGSYFRADDWEIADEAEQADRQAAIDAGADPSTLLVGLRDHSLEYGGGEARLDWRPADETTFMATGGIVKAASVFDPLTFAGLPIQITDSWSGHVQARLSHRRFSANVFVNAVRADSSIYLTSNGFRIADRSTAFVGQMQHGFDLGSRQSFTYGAELQRTIPRSLGTIHQFTEAIDNLTEVGVYLHSETAVSAKVDIVASGRIDYHSVLGDVAVSPSVGVVFKPEPSHALRLTYGTGFATPGTGALFNDFPVASFGPYNLRILGLHEDLTFRRDCGGVCMRSPFNPDAAAYLPSDATLLWSAIVAILQADGIDLSGIPAPTSADVQTILATLNLNTGAFDPVTAADVTDVARWKRLTHRTVEVGYKGLIGDNASFTVDIHYNDMGPVFTVSSVPTPNVFFDPVSLEQYLATFLPPGSAAGLASAIAGIPVGTVTPEQANDPTALLLVQFQGSNLTYWGADVAITVNLSDLVQAHASYSWTSKDLQEDVAGLVDFTFLNPKHRGAFSVDYDNEQTGVLGSIQGRIVDGFPALDLLARRADVDAYTVVDATVGYKLPWFSGITVSLTATNLLDNDVQQVPNSPFIGRLLLGRVRAVF